MSKDKNKEKNFISIVVQLKNSSNELIDFFNRINEFMENHFESFEYVVINNDDARSIGVLEKEIRPNINKNINIINLSWKHNTEDAMRAGLDLAIGDFIIEFDKVVKGLNTDKIMESYQTCLEGNDVVSVVPKNKNLKITSKLFYKILNKVSYKRMDLTTEIFRIVSRRALYRVMSDDDNFKYRKAAFHYSGFQTKNIIYDDNYKDKSNDILHNLELGSNILIYYSNLGSKISAILSLIFLVLSALGGTYTIYSYFTVQNIEPGWTTIMLYLTGSFTGLFAILTFISKYLEVTLKEIRGSSSYTFESLDKFS